MRAPYNLQENANIFFAGFGISYGPWEDRTEAFIALNNIDVMDFGYSFETKSIKSLRDLSELKDDPMDAYLESQDDTHVWHPIEYGFVNNEMRLHGFRHFEKTNDDRDFKLGTTRQWTVGFYDYHTGAGAWSDNMELVLESGFDVESLENLVTEPQPSETGANLQTNEFFAKFDFEAISLEDCETLVQC